MGEQRIKVNDISCGMTISGRGYVSIASGGVSVIAEMSDHMKAALTQDPEGWRKEMNRLKGVARDRMKRALAKAKK